MVGASGAVAGVLGAYLILFPEATVLTLMMFGFFYRFVHIPAAHRAGVLDRDCSSSRVTSPWRWAAEKAEVWRGSLTSAGSWQGCCCCFYSGPGKAVAYNQRHGDAGAAGPAAGGQGARREPREGDPSHPGRRGPGRRPAGRQGRLADPHRRRPRHPRPLALREPRRREARPRAGALRDRGQGPHLHRRRLVHRRLHRLPAAAYGDPDLRGGCRHRPARCQAAQGPARGGHGADQRPRARPARLRRAAVAGRHRRVVHLAREGPAGRLRRAGAAERDRGAGEAAVRGRARARGQGRGRARPRASTGPSCSGWPATRCCAAGTSSA